MPGPAPRHAPAACHHAQSCRYFWDAHSLSNSAVMETHYQQISIQCLHPFLHAEKRNHCAIWCASCKPPGAVMMVSSRLPTSLTMLIQQPCAQQGAWLLAPVLYCMRRRVATFRTQFPGEVGQTDAQHAKVSWKSGNSQAHAVLSLPELEPSSQITQYLVSGISSLPRHRCNC